MRGMDETCLLSMAEVPGGCVIKAMADQRLLSISCPIESLTAIESGGSAHLAGPDGLCAIERGRQTVLFRFITSERIARSFEVDTPRFDAAVAMLATGLAFSLS